jgi:hypothetical protein
MDTTQVENQFRVSTKMPHVWPESIDMDRFGNIYFTDAAEGTLYRIRRNKDNSLARQEEALLKDLKELLDSALILKDRFFTWASQSDSREKPNTKL